MSNLGNKRWLVPSGAKVIYGFDVLWSGWECDSNGRVYEHDGERFLVLTNHGTPYRADPQELRDKIEEYRTTIFATEEALRLLAEPAEK